MHGETDFGGDFVARQQAIEKRLDELWTVAIIVTLILGFGVVVVDLSTTVFPRQELGDTLALTHKLVRCSLVFVVSLVCLYLRGSVRKARQVNNHLLSEILEKSALLERRNSELNRLKEISDRLVGSLDMREGLEVVLSSALEIPGAEKASVLLLDEESGILDHVSVRTSAGSAEETDMRQNFGLAEWVVRNGRPLIIDGNNSELEIKESDGLAPVAPMVLAPITVGDRTLGVLSIVGSQSCSEFAQEDLSMISALADQAGLAIEKMRLYKKLREQVIRLRSVLRDLRQAQAGLVQSEKLASLGQLVGGVAHEINNPLLVILGRAEMILTDMDPRSPQARDLEIIRSETERIAGIVRNLLSFARVGKMGVLSPVDVNEIINRTLDLVQTHETEKKVTVITRLAQDLPPVYVDTGELQQIYTNIAINAFQAMKQKGGKLIVETSQDDAGYVVAKFADTGPGISPENLSKIFDPFFTTKPEMEGTGLGLSVCRGLVEKYNGKIEVETRVGHGATFIVKLPAVEESSLDLPDAA